MNTCMGPGDVEVMKACLQILNAEDDDDPSKENALEVLAEKAEDIDSAKDLVKIGGIPVVFKILSKSEKATPSLQWRAAEVVSLTVQNNPVCQEAVLAAGGLDQLLDVGKQPSIDDTVLLKVVYALSSLTRDCSKALEAFLHKDGISFLAGLLGKERGSKLKVKALFMMRNMCVDDKSVKNLLFEKGMIEELIHLLVVSPSADELSEHVIGTLVAIAEGHDKCMSICRKPELGLLECLQKRTEELTGNEAFQEERESSACLLKLCFDKDTK
eukprot:m.77417 g.77417  ORF g.77417 m.77417 type:complete len:271 (+) comp36031_c0_seq2:280-1092(+)